MKTYSKVLASALLALACCSCGVKAPVVQLVKTYSTGESDTTYVKLTRQDDHFRLSIPVADYGKAERVEIHPDFATAEAGEDGFFLTPDGMYCSFKEKADGEYVANRLQMAMWGSSTPAGTWLAIIEGMRFETAVVETVKDGKFEMYSRLDLKEVGPYEDIVIDYYPLEGNDASYSGMGRRYRKYQLDRGEVVPLKERIGGNKYLEYAAAAPEIRIRQGWKPAPPKILEQTLENEPPMKVAVTFDRVRDIIDSLKAHGVDKAELCLVGWNVRGHDGRWPTALPVEPALGGEEKLRSLIKYAQDNGFQIVCHTNSGDCYTVSPDLDTDDIARTYDGQWFKNEVGWSGGQMYHLCYKQAWEHYVQKMHDQVKDLGFRGIQYVDVISSVYPTVCYDKNHPQNKKQAAEYAVKHLKDAADKIGGVASESGFDHVASVEDYVLYVTFLLADSSHPSIIDAYVPVWNIVYNGIILNNCATITVNYTIKKPQEALKAIEYGSRPTFYFYSAFKDDGDHWMGTEDLRCATPEELSAAASAIAKAYKDQKELGYLQYEFMEDHCRLADKVFRALYSDGSEVVCNYGSEPYEYKGRSVAPESWALIRK